MGPPDTFPVLAQRVHELCLDLQALRDAAQGDADAEEIDRIVSRCEDVFWQIHDLGTSSFPTHGCQAEASRNSAHGLLTHLKESYEACIKALGEARAHTGEKLAEMQKIQAASRQYGKIAGLG